MSFRDFISICADEEGFEIRKNYQNSMVVDCANGVGAKWMKKIQEAKIEY